MPDKKTSAELAGIKVQGENKWLTLMQNASQAKEARIDQLTTFDSNTNSSQLTKT